MSTKRLSIIIPVFNEKNTVEELIGRVQTVKIPIEREIIAIDDGSTDGTREILERMKEEGIKVVFHEKNSGKGAAIRTGILHATGEYIVIQDADLEYDPEDYPQLLEPLLGGRADVVYGSRFIGGGPHRVHLFWHYVANKLFTLMTNALFNVNLTDMGVCYKMFRSSVLKSIPLRENGFGFEPEITAKICKRHLRIYEVPISYAGRTYEEGKKIKWTDSFAYLYSLIRYRLAD
ncbi:MAG: glycosyl transferase [Elusimicrobia bacterium]|nr:MAG: glycosyl transferase [Elusimicrobiota bacterium]